MSEEIKIVSVFKDSIYRNKFPSIPVLAEEDYFLQFNGFEVYLPKNIKNINILNIFELTILRILNIGSISIKDISEKLCLEIDLVNFICTRLMELNFITSERKITDKGREILGERKNSIEQNLEPYLLLVTRDSGEIFPTFFSREDQINGSLDKPIVKLTWKYWTRDQNFWKIHFCQGTEEDSDSITDTNQNSVIEIRKDSSRSKFCN